jgi:hypothetical protein
LTAADSVRTLPRSGRFWISAVVVSTLAALAGGPSAAAAAPAPAPLGYDVSYPQCGQALPPGTGLAIVGVNAGLPFGANPCLANELAWAGTAAELYANTADPGPLVSSHWPNGQTEPQQCNTALSPGSDTASCAYDYGWNAAEDSYRDAVAGYVAAGLAPPGATATPQPNAWWLDVELENSWEATLANNLAELQGELDYLRSVGAGSVGVYAPPAAWATVLGGSTQFSSLPFWLPGASSLADAQARCSGLAPNGGQVALVQFPQGSVGVDVVCAAVPALMLAGVPAGMKAGQVSAPLTITVASAPAASVAVMLTSSSAGGRFATAPGGPWAPTLSVVLPAGATASSAFYYEDPAVGTVQLTAAAPGYASASAAVGVTAPACTLAKATDHGPEIAVAQVKALPAAVRDEATLLSRVRATKVRARVRIEHDACADYELAVGVAGPQATELLLRRLRQAYPDAARESR